MKGFLAAVMMLTRLPLWRVVSIDKRYFTDVLMYWPLVGYLTGCVTALTLWGASLVMPWLPACVLAVTARLLFTGAMHEDGLADFLDGFGGGTSKEKILAIMKDSHIGSYGTIGLVVYFFLYVSFLYSLDMPAAWILILSADIFSKFCASVMINTLPYARTEEEAKTKVVYKRNPLWAYLPIAVSAFVPLFVVKGFPLLSAFAVKDFRILPALAFPVVASFCLRIYMKKKIGGYTGDCCGASFLITELACYGGIVIVYCL